MDTSNDTQPSLQKKRKYLQIIALIANLSGYSLLLWYSWQLALGIFLLFFALNLHFRQREEDSWRNNFEKFLNELMK